MRHADGGDVRLLDPERLVRERDRPTPLVLSQQRQRRHVSLLVDDVPLRDLRHDQALHQPEPAEPQRVDNPRDKDQPIGKLDVRPAPPDAREDHRLQVVDRDVGLLCQIDENETVLRDGDRPHARPVRKDKTNLEEGRRDDCRCDRHTRQDDEDVGGVAEAEQQGGRGAG